MRCGVWVWWEGCGVWVWVRWKGCGVWVWWEGCGVWVWVRWKGCGVWVWWEGCGVWVWVRWEGCGVWVWWEDCGVWVWLGCDVGCTCGGMQCDVGVVRVVGTSAARNMKFGWPLPAAAGCSSEIKTR